MNKLLRVFEKVTTTGVSICLLLIMILVSADALARYFFHAPIQWTMDVVTYYLLIIVAYLCAADTFRHGDHIQLDLFLLRMGPRGKALCGITTNGLAAVVFTLLAYGSACSTIESYRSAEFVPSFANWPVWLSFLPIALGTALLAIRLIHHTLTLLSCGFDPAVKLQEEI